MMTSRPLGYFEQPTLKTRTCRYFVRFTFTQGHVLGTDSCSEWPLNLQNCNNGALFGDGSKILQLHFSEDLARSDDILSWWSLPQLSATTVIAVSESFFQLGFRSQVVKFAFTFKLCSNNCCWFRGGTSWSNLKFFWIASFYGSCSFMCSMIHVCVLVFTNLGRLLIWFVRLLCCIQLSRMTCLGGGSRFRQVLLLFPATSFSILALA